MFNPSWYTKWKRRENVRQPHETILPQYMQLVKTNKNKIEDHVK